MTLYWYHPSHGRYEDERSTIEPKRRLDLGRDGFVTVMTRMEVADHCAELGKTTAAHALEDITTGTHVVPIVMLCACATNGAMVARLHVRQHVEVT